MVSSLTFALGCSLSLQAEHIDVDPVSDTNSQARSQPVFSGKPEGPFCLSCTFIFRNERNWMKKSARVSEKLVSPGLPGLQVATRLNSDVTVKLSISQHSKEFYAEQSRC